MWFNFYSHYHSSYPKNKSCMLIFMAHFVNQSNPKCRM